jgi:pimeloyl-ACP methyl ester carboxylesterase
MLKIAALIITAIGLGCYFYFAPRFNHGMVDYVLFHPPDRKIDKKIEIAGITGKHYKISSTTTNDAKAAVTLDCILFKAPDEKGVVLFSQGVGSSINCLADHFKIATMLDLGYSVCIYDHEGYGLSTGKCDLNRIVPGVLAAYDFLVKTLHYDRGSIIGYGESFGGGVTTELHKLRPLKAIILESTFISTKQWADDQAGFTAIYPSFLFMEPTFDNLAMLKGTHPPALLIAAMHDKSMPPSHAVIMQKEAKPPFNFVNLPNSEHAMVSKSDRPAYKQAMQTFFNQFDAH